MKKKPTGFVATCQCGKDVGALDLELSPNDETSRLLGRWLAAGCTITPRFAGTWVAHIDPCECENADNSGNKPTSEASSA